MNDLLVALVSAFAGGVVMYVLGLRQGKAQVRYQKGAEAAAEVAKRMAVIRRTLYLISCAEEPPPPKVFLRLIEQKNALRDYAARSSWLNQRIFWQVLLVDDQLRTFLLGPLERYEQCGEFGMDAEAVKEIDEEITPLHEELKRRIDAYLGIGEPLWTRARQRWRGIFGE